MGLLGNTQVVGDELQRCLAYYEAEFRVAAFQTREADLFNNALAQYSNAIAEEPMATSEVCAAANRLVQAAKEIIRRREEIQPIPEAAFSLHWAWHITSLAYAAWAQATLSAMEALANGTTPHYKYVRHLVGEHQTAWRKAQKEEKGFLKPLRIPENEIAKITSSSIDAAATDRWRPELQLKSHDEEIASETTIHFSPSPHRDGQLIAE